jgi:hypothetical protein
VTGLRSRSRRSPIASAQAFTAPVGGTVRSELPIACWSPGRAAAPAAGVALVNENQLVVAQHCRIEQLPGDPGRERRIQPRGTGVEALKITRRLAVDDVLAQ